MKRIPDTPYTPPMRWMILRHMKEVLDIEFERFEFPWDKRDFVDALRQRNCMGMVAQRDDKVLGYMVYELYKHKLTLLNFAVAFDANRQGVGRMMMETLQNKLSRRWKRMIVLHVRESNLSAQLFFKAMGFTATKVLRDYYEESPEAAYEMVYRAPGYEPSPESQSMKLYA